MPLWISVVFILLVATTIVAIVMRRNGGRGFGGSADAASGFVGGTLTVTGVGSEGAPDKNGHRYCTISGTILGPQTAPTDVYGRLVLGSTEPSPGIGADLPVVYRPGKVESSWRFGALG
ncbi:hypothetical protein [Gordonia phthalatica]|uniref:Uncharacterized protein n=1 Tax=Gordonia phthalatica TaxID=1136941 RepID=A0A0N7FUW9_9ACTN|nr:hypothetical protein [Gordonia phthalatica]ALG85527.1 hypothetical protein ACH46_14915 [Gordonia phthalatica]